MNNNLTTTAKPKIILDFEKPIVELEKKIAEMRAMPNASDIAPEIDSLQARVEQLRIDVYSKLTRWQRVQLARHPQRPYTLDYCSHVFTEFIELHGDRAYRDDPAIVGGLARLQGKPVMVIGHQKGRDTKQNLLRNFGMPEPEGYRKAYRLFQLAERFNRPIICFLDTPGAYPGLGAEERGQAEAIARNLKLLATLKTPIIVVVIGEGASGGALGIGVGDRILMLENAWYSVISPESCSSILWRSWDYKEQAAEALKLTAHDLQGIGVIDRIVPEPIGGAHTNPQEMFNTVRTLLYEELRHLLCIPIHQLVEKRIEKFCAMGTWVEG
ncbi:MAG: acetyl-CoA carboxylase carboxyltransferase subunit alpha [Bacteroidota bacterium]|nr:acetyl-CoA carboxylase carboxyltransferase subunit alpha [Candidatus Kapabacteria bacterium]MDW8219956.1 acetyl-CoA carboxylase carboxyltransferase subunit alpha [Bacteroidota bacterium]